MRNTFTTMRPSMMMLSFILRERMSMASGYGIVNGRVGLDGYDVGSVEVFGFLGTEGADKVLHEIYRTAEQGLVLLRALAHADKQFIVLLHQRAQQGLVVVRQEGDQVSKAGILGLIELFGKLALTAGAMFAGVVNGRSLGVDGRDGVDDIVRPQAGGFLLEFEEGEHFAILLQLIAKGLDQLL
jgi:hypothetical protein